MAKNQPQGGQPGKEPPPQGRVGPGRSTDGPAGSPGQRAPAAQQTRPMQPAAAVGASARPVTGEDRPRSGSSAWVQQEGPTGAGTATPSLRHRRTITKVDPWSVLKLSLVFYFCALLVLMLGLTVFWTLVNRMGVVDQLLSFLAEMSLDVRINGGMIARAVFLVGLLNVILWSGINVFIAFLYNLVADVIGGLRFSVEER